MDRFTKAFIAINVILIALMALFPWATIGVEPLVLGFVPAWVAALLVPYMIYLVLMAVFAGRRTRT